MAPDTAARLAGTGPGSSATSGAKARASVVGAYREPLICGLHGLGGPLKDLDQAGVSWVEREVFE
ncbi:MAG: hypothetical protein ABSA21_10260 [Candidatus Limnocylindrales bacterium]|jgi:hypothetical protein